MKKKKVIIVGAGMGGLTSAAYLSKDNYDVLLIEKNNIWIGTISSGIFKIKSNDTSKDLSHRVCVLELANSLIHQRLRQIDQPWDTRCNADPPRRSAARVLDSIQENA